MKILIYGGAFDPPHLGHASCIEAALRLFPSNDPSINSGSPRAKSRGEIWIMPSANRADKMIKASGEHRLEMVKVMVQELFPQPPIKIEFSPLELERPKLTTTYETLLELKRLYPNFEFWFLMGSELLKDVWGKWVNGPELYREANFLAVKNPHSALPKILPKNLILLKDVVRLDVSSTFLRKLLKKDSGIPYITPQVADFIQRNRLYR